MITMPLLSFPYILPYSSSNRRFILSLSTRFYASLNANLHISHRPTVAYYDDLVKAAALEGDFWGLRYLLNKRIRDSCCNTTATFSFITNTAASLSVLDDLIKTLGGLDPGYTRKSAFEALIARLCKLDHVDKAFRIVDVMAREEYGLCASTFHPILLRLTKKKEMEDAWRVVELMKTCGVSPDITAYNYLLTAYCFVGDLMAANEVMEKINQDGLDADSRTYDALVLGACRTGNVEGALVLLRMMEDEAVTLLYSTPIHVINGLLRLGYYIQAVKLVIMYGGREEGLDKENFGVLANKLMRLKRFEEVKLVLEEMENRGLVMGEQLREYYNKNVRSISSNYD